MAVVFISPQKRQRTFFMITGVGIALFFGLIFLWVFLFAGSSDMSQFATFNKPKVIVNFKIFESEQFKNLTPFEEIPLQFNYTAQDSNGKSSTGLVSAFSADEARKILENAGLKVGKLAQVLPGRDNPFVSY